MKIRFIDLFAGLGGFHAGVKKAYPGEASECVFVSEINESLAKLYAENHHVVGNSIYHDIRKVDETKISQHDLLCAGFPCQPFSKAGQQLGMGDTERGTLFDDIIRIVEYHKPRFLILENVANLHKHDEGRTWATIERKLRAQGYDVRDKILSPHQFGVPQLRQRMFIVASLGEGSLAKFQWPTPAAYPTMTIHDVLDAAPSDVRLLNERECEILGVWQQFLDCIPADSPLPSFPLWTTEFDATYPYKGTPPHLLSAAELGKYKGAFGAPLANLTSEEQRKQLPTYAYYNDEEFYDWKQQFIAQNRAFFKLHRKRLLPIIKQLKKYPFSWQKFEWNCKNEPRQLDRYIIQFRPSGIRVKRPAFSPALVAFTLTQVPAINQKGVWRYMTPCEGARLQSLGDDLTLPTNETAAYRALGNAVNADVIALIAKSLIGAVATKAVKKQAPLEQVPLAYNVAVL